MKKLTDIPIKIQSGAKYVTTTGNIAIKDGIKKADTTSATLLPKPAWLKITNKTNEKYQALKNDVHKLKLATVCEEAKCPNIAECWSHGTATIMLMGAVCTRACKFCSVDTGNPKGWLDINEPANTALTIAKLNLDYIVLTSVDRDDLKDGGAAHYAQTIVKIKELSPKIKVEALTPDFQGSQDALKTLLDSKVDVFAQNIETVFRLTHPIRDKRAGFEKTLETLRFAKEYRPDVLTKTSIMVGLGETDAEIYETMDAIRAVNVDILTLGQYLQPTKNHWPIARYVKPEIFLEYRAEGLKKGFLEVASGPMVRSSYRADKVFKKNNLGLA